MKNDKLNEMLKCITDTRAQKYTEEVERQKSAIEEALIKFLESSKTAFEKISRATIAHQNQNTIWFNYELDADVLPEVADYIAEEYALSVNKDYPYKVFGQYQV